MKQPRLMCFLLLMLLAGSSSFAQPDELARRQAHLKWLLETLPPSRPPEDGRMNAPW